MKSDGRRGGFCLPLGGGSGGAGGVRMALGAGWLGRPGRTRRDEEVLRDAVVLGVGYTVWRRDVADEDGGAGEIGVEFGAEGQAEGGKVECPHWLPGWSACLKP